MAVFIKTGDSMVNSNLSFVTEIAMLRSLPDLLCGNLNSGRLKGKLKALQKEVDKSLVGCKINQKKDLPVIKSCLDRFANETGWNGSQKSIGTILSFYLCMIEESEHSYSEKITDILNDLFEFFERKKPFSPACCWSGAVATQKWINIKKEVFH